MKQKSMEEKNTKKLDMKTLMWIGRVSGKGNACIVLLSILQSISGGTSVLYALFVRNIVDEAVAHNRSGFILNTVYFVLLVFLQIVIFIITNRLTEYCKSTMENAMKEKLFAGILRKDFSRVSAIHTGEWMNRLTNDTKVVADGFADILPGFIGMVVRFVGALAMIIYIDWRIAAVMVPLGIILAVLAMLLRKKTKTLHKQVQEADGLLRIFLQENLASLMLIRSFSAEEETLNEAKEHLDNHRKSRMRRIMFTSVTSIGFRLVLNGMYIFGICYGGYGILVGTMSYGTLMQLTQLVNQLQMPIVGMTGTIPRIFTTVASAERLMEVEEYEEEYYGAAEGERGITEAGKAVGAKQAALPGKIELEDILKIYENEFVELGLRDVEYTYYPPAVKGETWSKENMPVALPVMSLAVKKGEYVAFTGHSGCGKSTVLKLLMNIYRPDKGEEYIKLKNGEEDLTSRWRNLFAYVPQGNYLMSGTIRDVVCFAAPDRKQDEEAIREALRIAGAEEFVYELEDGVDTLLGERGTGLSEGQMQRLALARAVLSQRPVLLLDEATSALDEKTEKAVLENLRTMTDKTVIIVTHRPAALEICDNIIRFGED